VSEYTLTTDEVRESYQGTGDGLDFKHRFFERGEAFDRWLAEHTAARERAAAEKALLEAADDVELGDWSHHGNHDDHRDAEAEASTWLEKRAATYRLNEGEKQ